MGKRRRNTFFRRKGAPGSKGRKILIGLLAGAAVLGLLVALGAFQLLNWLQGDAFRRQLEQTIADKAQASEVHIPGNLNIDDELLSLPGLDLRRVDALQHAELKRIAATIDRSKLYSRILCIRKLSVEEATLQLDTAALGTPLPPARQEDAGFWSRFTPTSAILHAFECSDADIGLKLDGDTYNLSGCNITAAPLHPTRMEEWQLTTENGRLHTPLPYLQNCSIKTATLLYTPKSTILSECRFMLSPGELRAKGSYHNTNGLWHLEIKANKANVERILSEDWKKRLSGELYGELKLNGSRNNLREAAGSLSLQQGLLEGLPILSKIPVGNTLPYRSLELEKAECRLSYPFSLPRYNIRKAWLFDNIDVRARGGLLRVKGHVIVAEGGALRGTLTIGLPESVAAPLAKLHPTAASQLFNASGEAGFRWLNINLSGTTTAPQEDLTVRLGAILSAAAPEAALNATGKAAEAVGGLIDSLFSGGNAPQAADSEEAPDAPTPAAPLPSATDVLDLLF